MFDPLSYTFVCGAVDTSIRILFACWLPSSAFHYRAFCFHFRTEHKVKCVTIGTRRPMTPDLLVMANANFNEIE